MIVEADNALGSQRGDVDDGFALAALLGAGIELQLASTYGNTSEPEADRNNRALVAAATAGERVAHLRGCTGPGARDAEAVGALCDAPAATRCLALGPATTLAAALRRKPDLALAEVVLVGGDAASRGRWPPLWPHEFNFWHDRAAAAAVFASRLPLTLVPLDVGRRCLVPRATLAEVPGRIGTYLREHGARWFARSRRRLWRDAIRCYDLVAAARVVAPDTLRVESRCARFHPRGFVEFAPADAGRGRLVQLVREIDMPRLLATFLQLLTRPTPCSAPASCS